MLAKLLCTFFISTIFSAGKEPSPAKIEWINKALKEFEKKGEKNIPLTKITGGTFKNDDGIWYHSINKNGKIKFKDGSWMIIAMHSAHSNGKLGDISIIQTNNNKFYYFLGHYCADLSLKGKNQRIDTIDKFLQTKGLVPEKVTDSWTEYHKNDQKHP